MLEIKDYYCPNAKCKDYGLRDMGNLMKAGTYTRKVSGENKQMLKCKVCGYRFSETHGTLFAGSHYSDQTINSIICCISEGNGIRSTSRILNLTHIAAFFPPLKNFFLIINTFGLRLKIFLPPLPV